MSDGHLSCSLYILCSFSKGLILLMILHAGRLLSMCIERLDDKNVHFFSKELEVQVRLEMLIGCLNKDPLETLKRDIPDEKCTNAFLGYGPEDFYFVVELTYEILLLSDLEDAKAMDVGAHESMVRSYHGKGMIKRSCKSFMRTEQRRGSLIRMLWERLMTHEAMQPGRSLDKTISKVQMELAVTGSSQEMGSLDSSPATFRSS
ncbi:hypothetical protein HHK36_018884 [Tetracentron sinense]|uniref:DUF4094 domain-containing protein n=1 Tax=Tetracentron sinense TaxID=13715 RepID=A0A834YWF9_TETSI|nr:hypothetical protein HHK36_018884 [Tetracentron sinense]